MNRNVFQVFVIIDNEKNQAFGLFLQQEHADKMLNLLGDEEIEPGVARFVYEQLNRKPTTLVVG